MNFPTIDNMSELRKIEAGIGFTSGILLGAIAGFVAVMFYANIALWIKIFSAIGSLGIIGSLYFSLSEQIKARRNLISMLKEMDQLKGGN